MSLFSDIARLLPRVGSFSPAVIDGEPIVIPAIVFGQFAVHSSLGFVLLDKKQKILRTSGQISVSHVPTGMCFDTFSDLMSAVYLAQEMARIVPDEVANERDSKAIRVPLGKCYRMATLAAIGRSVGGSHG